MFFVSCAYCYEHLEVISACSLVDSCFKSLLELLLYRVDISQSYYLACLWNLLINSILF